MSGDSAFLRFARPAMWMLVAFTAFSFGPLQKPSVVYPLVHIGTLAKTQADTVRMKAYVLDIYVCPPCPEGMICKPCIENNFTVIDEKPVDPMRISPEKKLRVFHQRPDSLKPGKRYLFTLRFRNKKVSPADNVEMVSFKPL